MEEKPPEPVPLNIPEKTKLESSVETEVCDFAKEIGCKSYKIKGTGDVGKPDRVFACGGPPFFVEFKQKGKRPNRKQRQEHAVLRDLGCDIYTIDNVEDGKALILSRRLTAGIFG